jgi:hypothetical protein
VLGLIRVRPSWRLLLPIFEPTTPLQGETIFWRTDNILCPSRVHIETAATGPVRSAQYFLAAASG